MNDSASDTATGEIGAPIYDSAQRAPVFWEELVEIWQRRELVMQMVVRDLKSRYKRSLLGFLWSILSPLLMMGVLTLVFALHFREAIPGYPVYVLTGLILWRYFSQASIGAASHILGGAYLLQRVYVPRTIFALSVAASGIVNLALSLIPLAVVMAILGFDFSLPLVVLPVAMILLFLFTLGVGLLLSSLAPAFRDVVELFQAIVFLWYFLTPIMYPKELYPSDKVWVREANPMYHLVEIFRIPVYEGAWPPEASWIVDTVFSLGALVLGWIVFSFRADKVAFQV